MTSQEIYKYEIYLSRYCTKVARRCGIFVPAFMVGDKSELSFASSHQPLMSISTQYYNVFVSACNNSRVTFSVSRRIPRSFASSSHFFSCKTSSLFRISSSSVRIFFCCDIYTCIVYTHPLQSSSPSHFHFFRLGGDHDGRFPERSRTIR